MSNKLPFPFRLAGWMAKVLPDSMRLGIYRLPFVSQVIRSTLTNVAPDEAQEVNIAGGLLKGYWLLVRLQSEKPLWLGTHEPGLMDILVEHVRPGMVAYDIGGHAGYFAFAFAHLVGPSGLVYTFEPFPPNAHRIRTAIALNHTSAQVELVEAAVSDKTGTASFSFAPNQWAKGGLIERKGLVDKSIQVRTVSIDDFVYHDKHDEPDIVKMDVEGAEGLALKGMHDLLTHKRPTLIIEIHGQVAGFAVFDILADHHYLLRDVEHHTPIETGQGLVEGHILATPE